jgi:phosphomethylpyrimidine synthase
MNTQMDKALRGTVTPEMNRSAGVEKADPENVRDAIARGHAVLPANPAHIISRPSVVGRSFRTKVNANIGRSTERSSVDEELTKLKIAVSAGADFVMDLSVGPDLSRVRQVVLEACPVPLGTVPVYEALWRAGGDIDKLSPDLLISVIKEQAEAGIDFMTLHAGLLRAHMDSAMKRVMGIVSRGGAVLGEWMMRHDGENPLYSRWDDVLDICSEHDVTVSLGDGLRPGCLADASDAAQFAELDTIGMLVQRCRQRRVQVMVEGPGHIPFNEIQPNMEREQKVCDNAPFYVLGPVVTDIAPGYDHIVATIGATAAAYHGAALLCYVTPAEHLGLPTDQDVKDGVVAFRIAAHAADVARNLPGARDVDDQMALARRDFDWERQFELALDGEHARKRYRQTLCPDEDTSYCSMCGKEFCAVRATKRLMEENKGNRLGV